MNTVYAFLLSSLAGISTIIGFLFIFIKKDRNKVICRALAFASGVMITISIIDLIPNSLKQLSKNYNIFISLFLISIFFIIGVFLSNLIDNKIEKGKSSKLYKLGIVTMIVILLHNIPEGIVTYITSTKNIKLGITLAIAIALHNIPEGISVGIPIYYSTKSKSKSFLYTLLSGIAEPIGALLAYLFLSKYINDSVLGLIYSFIAGMMINIGINELYKESITYEKKYTYIYILIGASIMIITHILLG